MDKYEYNEKAKQINDRIEEKDYMAAARIADGIDWKRVKSVKMLTNVGSAYAEIGRYEDAKEIFLIAFQRAPMGRRLAYKLTELSIIAGKIEEAEMYYHEFLEIAPKDISRYELLYKLEKKKGKPIEELIRILEEYKENEFDDIWAYELARLYHKAGMSEACITECDEIILWFGEGEYVEKAKELKAIYVPPDFNKRGRYRHQYEPQTTYISQMNQLDFLSQEIKKQEQQVPKVVERKFEKEIENEPQSEEKLFTQAQYYDTMKEREEKIEEQNIEQEEQEEQRQEEKQEKEQEKQEESLEEQEEDTKNSQEEKFDSQEAESPQGEDEQYNIYRVPRKYLQMDMPIEEIVKQYGRIVKKEERQQERMREEQREREELARLTKEQEEKSFDNSNNFEEEVSSNFNEEDVEQEETEIFRDTIEERSNEISETVPVSKELSEERKQIFAQFLHMQGVEAQLAEIFEEIDQRKEGKTTSFLENIIIIGEHKSGKTKLAVDLLKEINKTENKKGKKVAKISGGRLNNKDISETILRLHQADLLIEQASDMNKTTVKELLNVMSEYTGGMIVVLEDTKENIEYLLKENPDIKTRFNYQIILKEYDIADWVEKAREYAKGMDYIIDEMATLALSAKIDGIFAKKTSIEIDDIKHIVNKAIEKSEKKNLKKLFDTVFSRKYKDSDLTVLREADFE